MNLMISLYPILIIFIWLPKCHTWNEDDQYRSLFQASDLFHVSEYLPQLDNLYFTSFLENSLLYNKIIENQIRAHEIISDIQFNSVSGVPDSRGPFYNNVTPKPLFFADYPHTRALLRLQWKRLRNNVFLHNLGSLRSHSAFYRP